MLRPATPLSVIFLVAFVLLLLSTLSTPVIEGIPLGHYQGYNFGVLGYCKGNNCTGPLVGYSTDGLFSGPDQADAFSLDAPTRNSLSSILIVHPIAALLTLVCFGLAVAAHFHGPSHSPRYLLALLILTFPTLLVTLLAFLVDILLFVPHMQWGGWIVLAATILIIGSSIVTCAMRRTLVSRKARKKRIAENADMNGANYYDNLAQQRMMADSLPKAESPPPMSGTTAVDKNSQVATFEMQRQDTHDSNGPPTGGYGDDRTLLNPARDPSVRSASTNGGRRPYEGETMPPMPGQPSQESGMGRPPSRDQYGNLIPPGADMGMAALRHQHSQGSLGSNRSNGPPRGRGGFGPPPPGFNGRGRGGYGPPRGGYGPRGGRGGYGPPPGFNRRGRGGYGPPPPGMMGRGGPRQMPPPGYASDNYYGAPRMPSPRLEQPPHPNMHDQFVAGPTMPIGQAIEMDERSGHGQEPQNHPYQGENAYGLRDSDGDVAGMVSMMQGRADQPPSPRHESDAIRESQPLSSPTSMYSDQQGVPPRSQWHHPPSPLAVDQYPGAGQTVAGMSRATMESMSSDPHSSAAAPSSRVLPLSPVAGSPARASPSSPRYHRANSENYYEDVDPRFAADPEPNSQYSNHNRESGVPNALTPGPGQAYRPNGHDPYRMNSPPTLNAQPYPLPNEGLQPGGIGGGGDGGGSGEDTRPTTDHSNSNSSLEHNASRQQQRVSPMSVSPNRVPSTSGSETGAGHFSGGYLEPIPDGAQSPGEASESSHFSSVSQRGVNPNWRPGPPSGPGGGMYLGPPPPMGANHPGRVTSSSAAQRRKEDVILRANPDFSLPGMGIGMGPRGRGRGRGSLRGRGATSSSPPPAGLTPAGRYPTGLDLVL